MSGAQTQAAPGGAELVLESVGRSFGSTWALDDVSLSIPPGRIQAVIGRSGAGKSTLFRCLATLDRPDRGRILLDGVDLTGLQREALGVARRRIGTVFQQLHLLPSRTASANVALPLELAQVPADEISRRVEELLGWVGLQSHLDRPLRALSGGEKQRVAIARALVGSPRLLLCDEPTSALDPETAGVVLELIERARAELGVTVVLISHDLEAVRRIADRVAVLEAGRLVAEGSVDAVLPRGGPALRVGGGHR